MSTYGFYKDVADAVERLTKETQRETRRDVLFELAPLLCVEHFAPGDCEGPLVYEYELRGRRIPVCAHHLPYLLADTNVRLHVERKEAAK